MPIAPGTRLGPYEISTSLGAGGMGEVYRARDTRLQRTVAIKILPAGIAADPAVRARFEREGQALSQIDHPHICALYDVGTEQGTTFLVMQYLEGETLAARLAHGPLPVDQALRIAIEVCSALGAAHARGIVHRDLKPANIMLTKTGARLLDFGIARQTGAVHTPSDATVMSADAAPLTGQGTIIGTLHYMSPEQVRGGEADARSDIYALGLVLYEMLSGRRAFDAADSATLMVSILDRAPTPLGTLVQVPYPLVRAIDTAVSKDPDERWQTARDFLRELTWVAEERRTGEGRPAVVPAPAPSRRAWLAGAVAMVGLVVVAGVMAWMPRSAPVGPSGPPRIVLMDSPHPDRVYDPATLKSGGTNADDLTELLQDLPVVLVKESTGSTWRREEQVLAEEPAMVLVHRSCFYDSTLLDEPDLNKRYADQLYQPAADKLESLLGYIALGNPRTRFVVYSRGSWATEAASRDWVAGMERRFPRLKGRLTAYKVPLDRATFRNAQTGREIKSLVSAALAALTSAAK